MYEAQPVMTGWWNSLSSYVPSLQGIQEEVDDETEENDSRSVLMDMEEEFGADLGDPVL